MGWVWSWEDRPVRKERGRKPEGTISPWGSQTQGGKNLGARVIQMCHNDLQMRDQGNSESWLTVTSSHTDISSHLVKFPSILKDGTPHHLIREWTALSDATEDALSISRTRSGSWDPHGESPRRKGW